jgi:hypothetical protein
VFFGMMLNQQAVITSFMPRISHFKSLAKLFAFFLYGRGEIHKCRRAVVHIA